MAFSKYLYINKNDFILEKPNKKWKRLALNVEVRLMYAYFIKAVSVDYDEDGNIEAVHCTYDPETKSGSGFDIRKPNGTLTFVEKTTAKKALFNIFEPLFIEGSEGKDFKDRINHNSWYTYEGYVEKAKDEFNELESFQFIRDGYYTVDKNSNNDNLIFNQTVALKSSFK